MDCDDLYQDELNSSSETVINIPLPVPVRQKNKKQKIKTKCPSKLSKLIDLIKNLEKKIHCLEVRLTKTMGNKKKTCNCKCNCKEKMADLDKNKQTSIRKMPVISQLQQSTKNNVLTNKATNNVIINSINNNDNIVLDTLNISCHENKSEVLLVADSHGREAAQTLKSLLPDDKFKVTVLFMPNAKF